MTCFTDRFYIMFQCMMEILALYNDLFSSLRVDLKIVLELWNKYILLHVLVCSIAVYFYELCRILTSL